MPRDVGGVKVGTPGPYPKADTLLHVQECAKLLGSLGGRGAAIAWCKSQGFGGMHTRTVLELAARSLVEDRRETVDQTRARLLTMLESELKDAADAVTITKSGDVVPSKDRAAIAAFTRLVVTLTGLDVRTVQHVHAKDRPLREMTTQQLVEEEERLAKEIAERATPVDGVVTETSAGVSDGTAVLNDDASEDA